MGRRSGPAGRTFKAKVGASGYAGQGLGGMFLAYLGPQPAPLSPPVEVTFGYQKVGHLAPIVTLGDELKKLGINLKLVECVRYADARTALLAGSLDIATVGPADLAIALSQGSTNVTGLMGVGGSPKYVIGRNGVKLDSWDDIKGKKFGVSQFGSASDIATRVALRHANLDPDKDVSILSVGSASNRIAAMEGGAAIRAAVDRFLAVHGDGGQPGFDIASPSWSDEPRLLLIELARLVRAAGESPAVRHAGLVADAAALERRTREELRDRPADLARFEEVLVAAQACGALSEEHNYWIDRLCQAQVRRFILRVGTALAGAGSMALGEWLSVQSSRELYTKQIEMEREEIETMPEEEEEELALIYQARGLEEAEARKFAASVMSNHETAIDAMAREELGIEPSDLGGSAWQAAITSFFLFAF